MTDELSGLGSGGVDFSKLFGESLSKPIESFRPVLPEFNAPDYSDILKRNWHQLIILGNGFDLQCGLRSSFGDFFRPRLEIISSIADDCSKTWDDTVRKSGLTLWDFILNGHINSNWCDIEAAIAQWILPFSSTSADKKALAKRAVEQIKCYPFSDGKMMFINGRMEGEQDDVSHMLGNIARYAWTLHPEIQTEGYNKNKFLALLKDELTKLEKEFNDHLSQEVSACEVYQERCNKLYDAIARHGRKSTSDFHVSTSLLSFNYTTGIRQCFDGGKDGVCVNVHGELGKELIFGIDGKECMDEDDVVQFTKTYRLMTHGGSVTDRLLHTSNGATIDSATDVIKFYGHSLGKADYSYFQSIFDGVNLYGGDTVLVFYTRAYLQDEMNDELIQKDRIDMVNKVTKLLNAYGRTMDNKDHGKNLIHKLLLEGRLVIMAIALDRW